MNEQQLAENKKEHIFCLSRILKTLHSCAFRRIIFLLGFTRTQAELMGNLFLLIKIAPI